jgi:hypothetical protein
VRILNRPLKIGKERNNVFTAVLLGAVHRLQQRRLYFHNVLWFPGARINEVHLLRPKQSTAFRTQIFMKLAKDQQHCFWIS